MAPKINGLSPDLIFHPSDTVFELMIKHNFTPLMLARDLKVDYLEFDEFLKGKSLLSDDKFKLLSKIFNLKETFFLTLVKIYKETLMESLNSLRVSEFEFKIVNEVTDGKFKKYLLNFEVFLKLSFKEKVEWLRNYFKINSLDIFKDFLDLNASFRTSKTKNKLILEKIFLITNNIKTYKSPVRVKASFTDDLFTLLKEATFEKTIDDTVFRVREILKENGINFIYYRYDSKLMIQGFVVRYKDEIYLGVSDKGKYHDIFWFTLCHELGHLLLGVLNFDYAIFDDEEKLADSISENILIPEIEYLAFTESKEFTSNKILEFSIAMNVAPGIIVGRLQKDNLIPKSAFNYLKKKG